MVAAEGSQDGILDDLSSAARVGGAVLEPAKLPAIGEYGAIGDTRTAAIAAHGSIDWLCLPRFDSPPVFGRLVGGRQAGSFSIRPARSGPRPSVCQYRADSAVIETVWRSDEGEVTLTDGLVVEVTGSLLPQTLLVRRVQARGGPQDVLVRFDPCRGEGRRPPRIERRGEALVCLWQRVALAVTTAPPLRLPVGAETAVTVRPGAPVTFAVAAVDREPLVYVDPGHAWRLLERSDRWWRGWARDIDAPAFARDAVVRSMITLRLLTYAPSGAPVASPTTSLPEWPGASRNWDYRYAWTRDASIGISASLAAGKSDEATAFLYWLLHAGRVNRPHLPPALTLDGRPTPPERAMADWIGYRGSRPVRVGNAAGLQHQLDGYGWVVDAAWAYHRAGGRLYGETWRMLYQLIDFVARHWHEPDAGIWEVRGEPRHYVHSKLMGWLALDRGLRMAHHHRTGRRRVGRWRRERDALAADIRERGFDHRRGSYLRTYDTDELDAALLLLPIIEFEPARSLRVIGTVDAVHRELSAGGPLLYRYPPGTDGLEGPEGAFLPASFWLAQGLAATGRIDDAGRLFEDLVERASPLGLFAEEIHPETGEHLGNMPMAFSHGALVQAALAIEHAEANRSSGREETS
ncbi:MAG: glycoside hydrolase family 15 protein [Actinobacteria bacterium]|nr:glycoside hydrolase family 15 protein [Actinomycetota bacterium]